MAASPAAAVGVVAAASAAVASAAATLVHWTCFDYTRDAVLIVYLLLVSLVIYLCLRFALSSFTSVHFTLLRSSLILTATATSTSVSTAMRLRTRRDER